MILGPPSNQVSCTPRVHPNTGKELVVLQADTITGKSTTDPVSTGEWIDTGPQQYEPVLSDTTFLEDAINGLPAVRFGPGEGLFHWGLEIDGDPDHLVDSEVSYAYMMVWRVYAGPLHLDIPFEESRSAPKVHLFFTTTGDDRWIFHTGSDQLEISPNAPSMFSDWALVQVVNPRDETAKFIYNGATLATFDGSETGAVGVHLAHEGIQMDIAAYVLLEAPGPPDLAAWRSYLASKYGLTA